MKNKSLLLILLVLFLFAMVSSVEADVDTDINNQLNLVTYPEELPNDREIMKNIILRRLVVWTRPSDGQVTYSYTCRSSRFGCEARIEALVGFIFEEAQQQKFDPWLVAAMAWHESHFNPFAVSGQNAFGILQMLRRSRWSSGLRFVHNARFRRRCRNELGGCQREIVERSIYWTRRTIAECGSIQGGLRMYNSGHCDGPRRYPRIVLGLRRAFLSQAEEYRTNGHFTEENNSLQFNPVITCSINYSSENQLLASM